VISNPELLRTKSKLLSLEDLGKFFAGYLVLQKDLSIARVSESFASSLGYAPAELLGREVSCLLGEPTIYWLKSTVETALKEPGVIRNEITIFDRDHQPRLKTVAILRIAYRRKSYYLLLDEGSVPEKVVRMNGPSKRSEVPLPFGNIELSRGDTGTGDQGFPSLSHVEKEHIKKVLAATGGNRTRASEILGISRVTLLAKIKQYALAAD